MGIFRRRMLKLPRKVTLMLCMLFLLTTTSVFYLFITQNSVPGLYEPDDDAHWKNYPYIFIGGYPRSGTTLMRVLVDVHPDLSCGPETHVNPNVASTGNNIFSNKVLQYRMKAAHLYPTAILKAYRAFFHEILEASTDNTKRICSKDPYMLRSMEFLNELFPQAKFILMIRDGRAVAASIIKRHVSIKGLNTSDPSDMIKKWDNMTQIMDKQCRNLGPAICLEVKYEELVLQPRKTMTIVSNFLNVPWTDAFLNHENFVNDLSPFEMSTSQVVHPINLDAITSWAKEGTVLPKEFLTYRTNMLEKFGYWPNDVPPKYGVAEPEVLARWNALKSNALIADEFSPEAKKRVNFSEVAQRYEHKTG